MYYVWVDTQSPDNVSDIARLMKAAFKRKIYVDLYSGKMFIFQIKHEIIGGHRAYVICKIDLRRRKIASQEELTLGETATEKRKK